jgi:sec-independent protein translocase protein TatA
MPFGIGLPEILILLLVALLIFGPKRLPEMGRSLGRGMREFKDSVSGKDDDEPVHRQQARELEPVDTPRVDETPATPRERDSVT